MTKRMTADEMAVQVLLDGGPRMAERLMALFAAVEQARYGGACPQCGHPGPHDDNGETGPDKSFCCTRCGEQWDAVKP